MTKPHTYKDSGVDLDRSNTFVERLRSKTSLTLNPLVLAHVGGFAGAMELPEGYKKPVLVASADGVGSKLKLALHDGNRLINVGTDLVAMVVNDLVCCGAKPLFFLDYFAANRLNAQWADYVIEGMVDALHQCDAVLLGGETAELPGTFFHPDEFDIAGFGVGIVEKDDIIDGHTNVKRGDVVIGISSSGPHSNGYSLIRSIINDMGGCHDQNMDALMQPTIVYAPAVLDVLSKVKVKGIAHITGGGLLENIPRIVNEWHKVVLDVNSWDVPSIFEWLRVKGNVPVTEMYRVFNMGIGKVLIIDPSDQETTISTLTVHGLTAQAIGHIDSRDDVSEEPQVILT